MHTTEIRDKRMDIPDIYVIHHDGDPKGGVLKIARYRDENYNNVRMGLEEYDIEIPFDVVAEFVGQIVNQDRIALHESWSGLQTLGFEER